MLVKFEQFHRYLVETSSSFNTLHILEVKIVFLTIKGIA